MYNNDKIDYNSPECTLDQSKSDFMWQEKFICLLTQFKFKLFIRLLKIYAYGYYTGSSDLLKIV